MSALRAGCNVICEKPLVLTERNLDAVMDAERATGKSVNVILQLRLHPEALAFKPNDNDTVMVRYQTPRGNWFRHSWKGDIKRSGGLATNIGIHLFDLLAHWYGNMTGCKVSFSSNQTILGRIKFERALADWVLSVNGEARALRSFVINDKVSLELSNGFVDLHTESYRRILSGDGFTTESARESIRICEKIREYTHPCL
jgi:UDP-N-acetyl-2-amino-2-deoxyglucuronate dehydrogenase